MDLDRASRPRTGTLGSPRAAAGRGGEARVAADRSRPGHLARLRAGAPRRRVTLDPGLIEAALGGEITRDDIFLYTRPNADTPIFSVSPHVVEAIDQADSERNNDRAYSRDEVGGFVFADPGFAGHLSFAVSAYSSPTPVSVIPDEREIRGVPSGVLLLGDWHVHPLGASDRPEDADDLRQPSDLDLVRWAACASRSGGEWLGVIAVPRQFGSHSLFGYLTRERGAGLSPAWKCEPARLQVTAS